MHLLGGVTQTRTWRRVVIDDEENAARLQRLEDARIEAGRVDIVELQIMVVEDVVDHVDGLRQFQGVVIDEFVPGVRVRRREGPACLTGAFLRVGKVEHVHHPPGPHDIRQEGREILSKRGEFDHPVTRLDTG